MLCYSFRLILYVYGVLENDGQLIMSGSMMNNPCLGCVEINTNFILYENRNRYFTIILCFDRGNMFCLFWNDRLTF